MRIPIRRLNAKGYTLIEMAMATVILGIIATTIISSNRFLNLQEVQNADRTFATEKAIQMYEELRALVNGNEDLGVGVLDNYSNGNTYDTVLTTDTNVDTQTSSARPDDPLSGNMKTNGYWRYMRQVEVNRLANDSYARQVTVKVYLFPGVNAANNQTQPGILLATVGGVLRTTAQPIPPTQVLDLYILDINSIPAWWAVQPSLSTAMQAAVTNMVSLTPGLQIRPHYIVRSAYGRDPLYQPSSNSAARPTQKNASGWVYFYPGYTIYDSNASGVTSYYYDPDTDSGDQNSLLIDGNAMVDNTSYPVSTTQFDSAENVSYSVADQYNNAMRYPDELAKYAAVTAAAASLPATDISQGTTEISERMLLEGMLSEPASFANSMIVNLHGELLPMPPMRNYSDAAKDPGNQLANAISFPGQTLCPVTVNGSNVTFTGDQGVRVVTHPELLYYPGVSSSATSVIVRLRVYAYYDTEDLGGSAGLPSGDPRVPAISLFFPDSAVTLAGVTAVIGNSLTAGASVHYQDVGFASPYQGAVAGDVTAANASGPMSLALSHIGPGSNQTLITLYNTPLRCGAGLVSGGSGGTTVGGLQSSDMLYGSEYIPCSPDLTTSNQPSTTAYAANSYTFTNYDLSAPASNTTPMPRNTARWIISLVMPITQVYSGGVTTFNTTSTTAVTIAGCHAIETYLGAGITTMPYSVSGGVTTPIYPDLSRTYVWCGDAFSPPYTEQYQFMGDPRDCPYLDVKVGGITIANAAVTIGPNAYNWWFKNGSSGQMASDGYAGFGASGKSNWSGGGPNINIDLPRYDQLFRMGLLNTNSIFTTTNGWSFYYYGTGGEIGFDHDPLAGGVSLLNAPFATSFDTNVYGFDSINGDGRHGSPIAGTWVAANVVGSSGVNWYQRSWLGELYPDTSYLKSWVTYGNLPSEANGTSRPETFYLEALQSIPIPSVNGKSNDGFESTTFYPCAANGGCNAFFNGYQTGTGYVYNHDGNGTTATYGTEQSLAVTTYNILPFPLPYNVNVQRAWYFGGGDSAPESNLSPYNTSALRPSLSIPSTITSNVDTNSRIFYNYSASTTEYGSGVVRMTLTNGGTTQVGYVVETGTSPSADVGFAPLAETALVYTLRTFLDGGQMAATALPGHITQLPLIQIYPQSSVPQYSEKQSVFVTVGSAVTYTSPVTISGNVFATGAPVSDVWWRFEGDNTIPNYYTEEYPDAAPATTATSSMTLSSGLYQESATIVYNLKYSSNGTNWYFAQDGTAAVSGVCDYATAHAITTVAPFTFNLPVTGSFNLTQGDYLLMAEAYRQGLGEHYSYAVYDFSVNW